MDGGPLFTFDPVNRVPCCLVKLAMKLIELRHLAALVLAAAAGPGLAQTTTVNRCEEGGRVVFQQAACPPGVPASQVLVPPANVTPAPARPAASAAAAQPASAPAPALPPRAAPAMPEGSPEQAACLDYLKPLLRDPASGRILSAEKDGRVLRVKLQAADARARPQIRDAACEFVNGRVDDGWSRIQLKRLGWFAPRVLVLGTDRDSRRLARALEESIEAQP